MMSFVRIFNLSFLISTILLSLLESIYGQKQPWQWFGLDDDHDTDEMIQARRRANRERRMGYRSVSSKQSESLNLRQLIASPKTKNKNWAFDKLELGNTMKAVSAQRDIVVAVIDTGIDKNHPWIKDRLYENSGETGYDSEGRDKRTNGIDDDGNGFIDDYSGWDFTSNTNNIEDNNGHGTHVSGIVLGGDNTNDFIKILPIKFYDPMASTEQNVKNTANAIRYAISQGVDIINYSAGGNSQSYEEKMALKKAEENSILVVTAAGNEGQNIDQIPYYPASYRLSNIISVGSINEQEQLLDSSNYGKEGLDIVAPGHEIYSAYLNNSYTSMTGTSQATAFVSNALAILIAESSNTKSAEELKVALLGSSEVKTSLKLKSRFGASLNTKRSLNSLKAQKTTNGQIRFISNAN